jgi:hypothetical protein
VIDNNAAGYDANVLTSNYGGASGFYTGDMVTLSTNGYVSDNGEFGSLKHTVWSGLPVLVSPILLFVCLLVCLCVCLFVCSFGFFLLFGIASLLAGPFMTVSCVFVAAVGFPFPNRHPTTTSISNH